MNRLWILCLAALTARAASAQNLQTVVGTGIDGFTGDNGPATQAAIGSPRGMAVAADGTVYFADLEQYRTRSVDPAGIIHVVAGNGTPATPPGDGDNGPATAATFGNLLAVAVDSTGGVLYIADGDDRRVRAVDLATGILRNFSGDFFAAVDFGATGPALQAGLVSPYGVAVDPRTGDVYFTDTGLCIVRRVDRATSLVTLVAGDPNCLNTTVIEGGNAIDAGFHGLSRIAVDQGGNLFVLDTGAPAAQDPQHLTRRVYRIDTAGKISTVAGGGTTLPGSGPATQMNIGTPTGLTDLAVDAAGTLYVANATQVFKVNLATGFLSVFAGNGTFGFSPDGTPPASASFGNIAGLAVKGGSVWIAEAANSVIRAIATAPAVPFDLIVDGSASDLFLNAINAVQGSVVMVTVGGRTALIMKGLTTVGANVAVQNNDQLQIIDLDALQSAGGSIDISGNLSMTSLDLSSLATVGGSLNIANDPGASAVLISGITSIGGNLTLTGTGATSINLGSLGATGGSLTLTGNTSATAINLGSLGSTGASLNISGNTSATSVNLGSLGATGGSLTITDNGSATVNLGSLNHVDGNVSINSTGTGTFATGSNTQTGGNLTLSTSGYGAVSGTTATGATSVTAITGDATMDLQISAASFLSPTAFTLTHLDPAALPPETGVAADGRPATIDPIVGYQFTFATPGLALPASLSFDVNLAGLSAADQAGLLAAVNSGTATVVTKGDAAGSVYQAFSVCGGAQQPSVNGCVLVALLDAAGNPTTGAPATIRFSNLVGHFSTWAVAAVTECPVPSKNLCANEAGYAPVFEETFLRRAGRELDVNHLFQAPPGVAFAIIRDSGCSEGQISLNGRHIFGPRLETMGPCAAVPVTLLGANRLRVHLEPADEPRDRCDGDDDCDDDPSPHQRGDRRDEDRARKDPGCTITIAFDELERCGQ